MRSGSVGRIPRRYEIEMLSSRRTAGLLILKDGEIALERYSIGSGPNSRRTGYSTTKSMTSTPAPLAAQSVPACPCPGHSHLFDRTTSTFGLRQ